MNRNSPYFDLRYRVDFRPRIVGGWETVAAFIVGGGWETVAAFIVGSSALAYAAECRRANSSFAEYRVMQRGPRGQWQEMSA